MGFIPEEVVESIRLKNDIVEVITSYVQLKKKGKNHVGLCPFHHEKTPSFTVTPDKQIFHCFGCNTGGNVFTFLMLKENLAFPEAVALLARRAGVRLPVDDTPADAERRRRGDRARAINKEAKDYYRRILLKGNVALEARQYLGGRGLSAETQEAFQLGYAPAEWRGLHNFLVQRGYRVEEAVEAGLVVKAGEQKYYDRFRSRVIIPIFDAAGRVVGFGGRVLDDTLPKYLNTPETPWFSKGKILYGLNQARTAIKEKNNVVVMEGYMDVIAAYQHGVNNAVASLGTSLTREQGKLILNYTRDVLIAFDADEAGVAASLRGMDILSELGCQVRIITIPDGKDPDEFIQKNGTDAWERLVANALPLVEYKIKQATGGRSAITVVDKTRVMQQVLPSLPGLSDIEREDSLQLLARALNLSWETVISEYKRYQANLGNKWSNPDNIVKTKHNIIDIKEKSSTRDIVESSILRLVLEEPALGQTVIEKTGAEPFSKPFHRKVFKMCLEAAGKPEYCPADIFNHLDPDEQKTLSVMLSGEIPGDNLVYILESYIDAIGPLARRERREEILLEIGDARRAGDEQRCLQLLEELKILQNIREAEKAKDNGRSAYLLQVYRHFLELRKP
ncbi:MAG: DNA primase [Eubacteriales bacterium]